MGAYTAARNPIYGLTGPLVVFQELAWPNEPIDEASQTTLKCFFDSTTPTSYSIPQYIMGSISHRYGVVSVGQSTPKRTTFKPPYLPQMGADSEPLKPEVEDFGGSPKTSGPRGTDTNSGGILGGGVMLQNNAKQTKW